MSPEARSAGRGRIAGDAVQSVDDLRHALGGALTSATPTLRPEAKGVPAERCPVCGSERLAALGVCPWCGEAAPDHEADPLYLVLRRGPPRPLARHDAVRLLSEAGDELHAGEVARQLADLPALFRAPLPDAMAARLAERLRRLGYKVDVGATFPVGLGAGEYVQSLLSRKRRLLPYFACIALSGALLGLGSPGLAALAACAALPWLVFDHRRFLERLTLSARLLANRVDMAPAHVTERYSSLLRDDALSDRLRSTLGSLLGEYARILDTLGPLAAPYPGVIQPLRQALAQLVHHGARLADKALSIEKAGDFSDPGLDERLAALRALVSREIEERAAALLAARDQRQGRIEWLHEVYGTLLVRLESITDTLRSVRERILETYVASEAGTGGSDMDKLVEALRRELGVVSDTVVEMEHLESNIPSLDLE